MPWITPKRTPECRHRFSRNGRENGRIWECPKCHLKFRCEIDSDSGGPYYAWRRVRWSHDERKYINA